MKSKPIASMHSQSNELVSNSSVWQVSHGSFKSMVNASIELHKGGLTSDIPNSTLLSKATTSIAKGRETTIRISDEVLGVPRLLLPYYLAFLCDSIATGLAMPLLPFFAMELGASAVQLSAVISANYLAQMVGCLVVGRISDAYGRRPVLLLCLFASSLSYFSIARSNTVLAVALSRIISGSFGGLVPILQSAVGRSSQLHLHDLLLLLLTLCVYP